MKHLFPSLRAALMLLAAFITLQLSAQRSCGSMEYLQQQIAADPDRGEFLEQIDLHTNAWIAAHGGEERAVVTIPVVFHVIWRTTAENISDARLLAQLDQLNKDYARLNSDAGSTPGAFLGVAANTQVQFCLAQRDPNGAATTGIVRRQTTVTSFSSNDAVKYTANGGSNAWPRDSYLNIWVCNLGGGLLGYAQFPGGAAATDGVVVLYSAVGGMSNPGTATPYHLGRTLTHEVGHWLNLRHIWGDANCGNDQVSDTPTQQTSNYGCPSFPKVTCSNGPNGDMFMNYMDYTDDGCMNIFTAGQASRMQALFGTGGSRAALLNSLGCVPPSGGTCAVPGGLASSSITASGATVSWSAVSGATSYDLQYKTAAASTWTTVNTAATSANLTGLASGTTYNYQVRANCSSGSSAYSAAGSFTTSAAATCATPSGLAASAITSSTATVSWTAVSGATSYNLQYKLASSSTWTTFNTTGTAVNFTSLAAGTSYNAQVQAVCSSGSSAYSSAITFTTSAAACSDPYESNNTSGTATAIAVNTNINGLISSSTDKDWFRFSNTSAASRIRIDLTTLPADYDVRLYRGTSTQVGISQNGGTTSEAIILNTTTVATYYIQVYGYNGAFSTSQCYTLRASISGTNFREGAPEAAADEEVALERAEGLVNLYPNPTAEKLNIDYVGMADGAVSITVLDAMGREALSTRQGIVEGPMTFGLPLPGLSNGLYVLRIQEGDKLFQQRFTIER